MRRISTRLKLSVSSKTVGLLLPSTLVAMMANYSCDGHPHLWGRQYLVKEVSSVTIKLTESQRDSLIDFIECNFYPNIQNDDSIDSIDYAIDLLNVYTRLRNAAKQRRRTEAQGRNEAFLPLHSKNEI